jgi:hypothetical protein
VAGLHRGALAVALVVSGSGYLLLSSTLAWAGAVSLLRLIICVPGTGFAVARSRTTTSFASGSRRSNLIALDASVLPMRGHPHVRAISSMGREGFEPSTLGLRGGGERSARFGKTEGRLQKQ